MRKLQPLAAFAVLAVIAAGCSTAPQASTATGGSPATSSAVAASPAGGNAAGSSATARTASPSTTAGVALTGNGSSGANNADTNRQQAVKFAQCMRTNGVRAFPDPDASGTLTIDGIANGSALDTNSAAFKQAMDACKDLQPAGFTGRTRNSQEQANALRFAGCVRDNGVKDFPDPAPNAPLVDTNRIPSTTRNGGMSSLNSAMQRCRDLAAGAGVTGGR